MRESRFWKASESSANHREMSGSRKRKRLWWGLGLFGVVLLAVILVALSFSFDGEALKQGLIEQARVEKQRELRIDGPLRLKFLPRLSVEMQSASLSNREGKGEFLRLGHLRGALEILPLLTGRIVVNRVEIRDWSLWIERDAEGHYNFDDLLLATEDDSAPLDLEVEKLLLLNGDIHWRDAVNGGELAAEQVYLRSDHLGRQSHGKLEMGGNLRAGEGDAHLGFALETLYRLDGAAQTLQLDQARLSLKGKGYGMERARLSLSARYARGDLRQMALDLVQLRLQGEGERQGDSLTGALDLAEGRWQRAALPRLKKLSASLSLKRAANKDKASARLDLDELRVQDGVAHGERLSLVWQGEWRAHGYKGEIATPVSLAQDADGLHLRADDVQGQAQVEAGAMLARALDARLDGKLAFDLGQTKTQGEGELRLAQDDSKLEASWRLLHGQPPRLSVQASLNQLNLDQYLRDIADAGAAQSASSQESIASEDANAGLEIDGTVRVGLLQYKGLRMENLESRIRLHQGRLEMLAETPPKSVAEPRRRPPPARSRRTH
jgi:uncharacterized protein involved in outer membrane biogenesis